MIATLDGGTSASRSHQADHVTAKPAKRTIEAASKSMAAAENLVQATARGDFHIWSVYCAVCYNSNAATSA